MDPSIFLDFNLPNAATWLYFSLLLGVALFVQFLRPLALRNADLLTLYLMAPGLLLLQQAHGRLADGAHARGWRELVVAYAWLTAGTGYWFARAVVDLALVRRPASTPNLNGPGLACLGAALLACLTAAAFRPGHDTAEQGLVGKRPVAIAQVNEGAAAVVEQAQDARHRASAADVRQGVERGMAVAGHLAVVVGLLLVGVRHFADAQAGLAMAVLYLLLPYTAFHVTQFHHVWPAALVVWAVFWYRRPGVSGVLLGLAAGAAVFPLALFPVWVGFYARRGAGRFVAGFAGAAAAALGLMALALHLDGGPVDLAAALHLADWRPWKVPAAAESLWAGVHWAYRLPVFVAFAGFLAAVTVWPSPKNLSHVIALSAAALLGLQFWYADRGGVYVLWYLPLLLMMVFRPNLTAHEPPAAEPGALGWAGAALRRVRGRRSPAPTKELAF